MSNTIGEKLRCTIFGQSHSDCIGVVIDGFPAGFAPDLEKIRKFMARRAPGKSDFSTARKEADEPKVVSGLTDGRTCGALLCAVIANSDARPSDYDEIKNIPRPGHADFTARVKYAGHADLSGGGQFSGRLTAPLCFAGALCMQYLEEKYGIKIAAHVYEIAGIRDDPCDTVKASEALFKVAVKSFPTVGDEQGEKMTEAILKAKENGDSVGGVIECFIYGVPSGIGDPMFNGVENAISRAAFGIPAVKGIEFGSGFAAAGMRGSENNDPFVTVDGRIVCATNNAGGVLGGITTGMPIVFRCAVKPTPSIARPQQSVDLRSGEAVTLEICGRHDPCIVPRAVPALEAAAAIAILDLML